MVKLQPDTDDSKRIIRLQAGKKKQEYYHIQVSMNIEITKKANKSYYADCVDLGGSPPIGLADSPEKALIMLLIRLLYSDSYKRCFTDGELNITLDGEKYEWEK